MNAKETIKRIAYALSISTEQETTKVEETAVVEEKVEDVKAEATNETTGDVKTDTVEDVDTKEDVKSDKVDTEVKESKEEAKAEDSRISDLQKQVDELSKLLEVAVSKDTDTVENVIPEIPEDKVEPLTHSPETEPETTTKKIGGHGGDVLSRVYKYMS